MQHARPAARQRRRVMPGVESVPRCFYSDEFHRGIVNKSRKNPGSVRSTPDARHHRARQGAGDLEQLGARLLSDHRLEFPDHARVRRGPHHRPDDVVGAVDVGDPVPDGLRGSVLQGPGARRDRDDRGPEEVHAENIQGLTAHVLLAHVDHTFQAVTGAHSRRSYAVLAGPGFGDDPLLPHPPGQEDLAHGVVDLVGPGVVQVLALEPDIRPEQCAEARRSGQWRRTADIVAQHRAEFIAERGICLGGIEGRFEFLQRRHQRLRHVLPAVHSKPRCGHCTGTDGSPRTAATNWAMRWWSFTPGADSTPDDTSTTSGASRSIARRTFSGCNPPATMILSPFRRSWTSVATACQLKVLPVPPNAPFT